MMSLLSLLPGALGGLFGIIAKMVARGQEAKIQERQALMAQAGLVIKDRQGARKKEYQFARRTIVITFMLILLAPIALILMHPEMTFSLPVTAKNGAFSFLFGLISGGAKEGLEYITVSGFVFFAPIYDMAFFIIGFYFGNGGTRTRF